MEEIWKEIPDYEGFYEASNLGNIRSLERKRKVREGVVGLHKGQFIKPNKSGRYCLVTLSKDGIVLTKSVHRLVALAHIPNPENLPEIDHINKDKTDNRIENLRWVSKSTNQRNKGIPVHNTSGHLHIRFVTKANRWCVHIPWLKLNRRFMTLEDAIKFRDTNLAEQTIH